MSRPIKHRGKWRIRWADEKGARKSAVFAERNQALSELKKREAEVAEIREGLRAPAPADRTFDRLCDYWLANRAKQKRSGYHDESIIRTHLRPCFGALKLTKLGVEAVDRFQAPPIRKPRIPLFTQDFRFFRSFATTRSSTSSNATASKRQRKPLGPSSRSPNASASSGQFPTGLASITTARSHSTGRARTPSSPLGRSSSPQRRCFYSVLFHELIHSAGHSSRLARKGGDK